MPEDFSSYGTLVADDKPDFSSFGTLEPDYEAEGLPAGITPREAKHLRLMSDMAAAQKEGKLTESDEQNLAEWEWAVEPFTPSGMLNLPGRLSDFVAAKTGVGSVQGDMFQKNKPIVRLPHSLQPDSPDADPSVSGGLKRLAVGVVEGLTTPEMVVTAPAAGPSRVVRALFGADIARHIPEQVEHAATVAGTYGSTPGEITEAVGQPAVSAAMSALIATQPKISAIEPEYPGLPDPDLVARNVASPGTVRATEVQRFGPPEIPAPEKFDLGGMPFEGARRFGTMPIPDPEIVGKTGLLKPEFVEPETRSKTELETRGKVSFGAEAPALLRNALETADELGVLPKSVEALKQTETPVAKSEVASEPVAPAKTASESRSAAAEMTPEQIRTELDQVTKEIADLPKATTIQELDAQAPLKQRASFLREALEIQDDLVTRLESIRDRFDASGDMGKSMSLPHPDAFKSIGKSIVYTALDIAIAAVKAGRTVKDAIGLAMDHIRKNARDFDEAKVAANLNHLVNEETKSSESKVSTPSAAPAPAAAGAPVNNPSPLPQATPAPKPSIGQRIGNSLKAVRDFVTIDPLPRLTLLLKGDNTAAVQHAYARAAVPRMIDDMLAKVFPDQYKNPEAMTSTMDVLNKDNILGGYDAFIERAAQAQQAGNGSAAAHWRQMANDIAQSHDLTQLAADVQAARANPEISANITRWNAVVNPELDQLYNEMKGMDPDTIREGRGRVFGARVNLLPKFNEAQWIEALGDEGKPLPSPSSSNYRNPNAKKDKFDRRAKFTGQYSDNPAAVLANVLSHRWNEVTKIRFINDLVDNGAVSWEKPADGTLHGQEAKPLPVKLPETKTIMTDGVAVDSATKQVERTLWVPENTVVEIRGVLDTDLRLKQNPVSKVLTGIQLAQLADAVSHTKNLHSVIANAQGTKALWSDVVRKMPVLSTVDSAVRITKVLYDIAQDTPEIRAEMAKMAKDGMLREHFPSTGIQKITKMQDMIHSVDTASRVIMNRFYDNLVERGLAKPDMANRRRFVQQVGEYNKRLMSPMMQTMSRAGFSPFIVAGRNFNRFGKRLLTGNPGFEAANTKAALQSRLVNFTTLGSIFVLPMMLNSVLTGSIWGRKGTPLGAVDFGQPEDEKGNHKVLDLAQLYGVRRGMRATGIESISEGLQNGRSADEIVGKAIYGSISTAAHPWLGPALGFGYSAFTGQRLDLRGGPTPVEARKVGSPGSAGQVAENARVAFKNQNPLLYSPLRSAFGDVDESAGKDFAKDFLRSPASAVGVRDVKSPALQKAQELATFGGQITKEQADRAKLKRELATSVREGNLEPLREAVRAGKLDKAQATVTYEKAKLPPIVFVTKRYLAAPDAMKVWELATDTEKKLLIPIVLEKLKNNKTMEREELIRDVKRVREWRETELR